MDQYQEKRLIEAVEGIASEIHDLNGHLDKIASNIESVFNGIDSLMAEISGISETLGAIEKQKR